MDNSHQHSTFLCALNCIGCSICSILFNTPKFSLLTPISSNRVNKQTPTVICLLACYLNSECTSHCQANNSKTAQRPNPPDRASADTSSTRTATTPPAGPTRPCVHYQSPRIVDNFVVVPAGTHVLQRVLFVHICVSVLGLSGLQVALHVCGVWGAS